MTIQRKSARSRRSSRTRLREWLFGPVDNTVGKTILNLAEKAHIPLTFMQRLPGVEPSNYPKNIFVGYVGTADIPGGNLSAQLLAATGVKSGLE